MNNAYVTSTLGATLASASAVKKLASGYPLILWQSTDLILAEPWFKTASSVFTTVYYY